MHDTNKPLAGFLAGIDRRVQAGVAAGVALVALLFVMWVADSGDGGSQLATDSGASGLALLNASPTTMSVDPLEPLAPLQLDQFGATTVAPPELAVFAQMTTDEVTELRRRPSSERLLDVGCRESVVVTPPAADLANVVSNSGPGTCFELVAGTYSFSNVRPKDYMSFLGTSAEEVIVRGNANTENAFSGTATGVNIGRMSLVGFQGSGGESRQEQAPIRGTSAIWASDVGQMATQWLIEDVIVSDNYATGILLGDHFTVRNSVFSGNGVTGISANEVRGGLVIDNKVFDNGFSSEEEAVYANGGGMKFVQSGSREEPLVVARNEVHDNAKIGIWCDIGCNGFYAVDNYVYDYGETGIVIEISANAWVIGNHITHTEMKPGKDWDYSVAGVTVRESANVLVEDNYINGAHVGLNIKQAKRPSGSEGFLYRYDGVTYVLRDVTARNNSVSNVRVSGVDVTSSGKGIAALDTIKFENNAYDDVDAMVFRWDNDRRLSFGQWQSANRDRSAERSVGPPPQWPPPVRESYTDITS